MEIKLKLNGKNLTASVDADTVLLDSPKNLTASGFTFINNSEVFTNTTETDIQELELGRIKNKKFGFHKLDDELRLGVGLPTPYDDELIRLGVRKPIPDVAVPVSGWKFTFFLPFWLCALIIGLIILYLLLVISKAGKNAKHSFLKTIVVYDYSTMEVLKNVPNQRIRNKEGITVSVKGVNITYFKQTFSPFLLNKQPKLVGRVTGGVSCDAKGRRSPVLTSGIYFIQDNQKNIILKVNLR